MEMDQIDPFVLRDDDTLDSYLSRASSVQPAEPPSAASDNPYALRDDDDLDSYFERVKAVDSQPKSNIAEDVGRLALQGISNVGGTIGYGLEKTGVAPETGRALQESDVANTQRLQAHLSPEQRFANEQPFLNPDYAPDTPGGSSYVNPEFGLRSVIGAVVPSVPGSLAMGVFGAPLAGFASKALRAAGIGTKTAQTVGSGVGFGASEGAFSGAQNAAQWGAEQREKPIEAFTDSPEFQKALAELGDPEQAKEAVINQGQSAIFNETLVKTGGISALTGGGVFGALKGAKASDKFLPATFKGMAVEAGQEAPQSYLEQVATNKATQEFVDPSQDPYEGALNAGIIGGIAGGVMGAAGGVGPLAARLSSPKNLAMPDILGPFGAGGRYANSKIAERINTALDDPTLPADKRQTEVDRIHARAKNAGVQDADAWREQAFADIANAAPIRREVVPPGEFDGQNDSPTGSGQPGTPDAGAPITEDDAGTAPDGAKPTIPAGQPGGRTAPSVDGEPNLAEDAGTELTDENANLGGQALAEETRKRTRDFVARVNTQFSDLSKLRLGKNLRDAMVANGIDPTQETPQSGFEKLSAIANTKSEEELKQEKAAKLAESGPIGRAAGAAVLSGASDRAQAEQQAQAEAETQKETGKVAVTDEEAVVPEITQTVEPAEQGAEPYSQEALAAVPDEELSVLFRNASKLSDGEQRKAIREAITAERNRRIETQEPVAQEVGNAETIRSDQGQLNQTREIGEGSEVDSSGDLYQPEQRPQQSSEGTALGQGDLQPEESEAPVSQAVMPEAIPEAETPIAEETPTLEETTVPTEATQPPGPISDESQNPAAQERPLEAEAQKVEPKRIAQIQSVIDKLDAKVAEKGSMGLRFVTAPLRKAATDLGVYDAEATPDQTVANIRAKLTELTPPAPEVVGKGRSGDVVRIGNEVEKNALNDEGKLYSLLADKEGIAKGYEKEGKVRLPYYKHVISVDTIAPEKRAQLRGLVAKNATRINRAVSELTNTGYSYNDPLQFGMDEGKKFDLLDFSNAQKSENPLIDNLSALSGFYKQFGAERMANAVSQVGDVLNFQQGHAKDGAEGLIGDEFEGVNYRELSDRLGGPATNAYFTTNARGVNIPDAAQTDVINGVKTVLTTRPLTEQEISEWELTPVVENLKSDVGNRVPEKTQVQPTERLLRGNPNPPTIKKLYEKEQPIIGDRFITPGGNSWTVNSISRDGVKSKIVIKNDKVNRSLEIYTDAKWYEGKEPDAQFSVQPQEHPVDAAGKLVVTHPENGQTAPKEYILNGKYAKAPVMFGDLPVAIENGVGSVREGVDKDGRNWKHDLKDNYGEITGVQGADKDHIDVFIKPQLTKEAIDKADTVYIVDQINTKSDPNAPKFDESKIMMGYDSLPEAKAAYFRNYEEGWKGLGAITPVKMADFKNWLKSGKTTQQFAPALKAQGATEAQNLNPANIRDEILPLFTNLENAQPKEVRKAAMEQITAHPLAERLQYVQDNFYDLLLDLEQNKKVDIKC